MDRRGIRGRFLLRTCSMGRTAGRGGSRGGSQHTYQTRAASRTCATTGVETAPILGWDGQQKMSAADRRRWGPIMAPVRLVQPQATT